MSAPPEGYASHMHQYHHPMTHQPLMEESSEMSPNASSLSDRRNAPAPIKDRKMVGITEVSPMTKNHVECAVRPQ